MAFLHWLESTDHALFMLINGWQGHPALDVFFLYVTLFGNAILAALAPVALLVVVHGRAAWRVIAKGLVISAPIAIAAWGLKRWVARPRPPLTLPAKVLGPLLERESFPSGHATTAFVVLGLLWAIDRRIALAWMPVSVLVVVSRVYLGIHYPSDVLVGAALGFFAAWGGAVYGGLRLYPKNGEPHDR